MRFNGWREDYWGRGVAVRDREFQELLTRARNSLGADVLYDAFVQALEFHATRFTPALTAWDADIGPSIIRETPDDRRGAIEAIKSELRRLLIVH